MFKDLATKTADALLECSSLVEHQPETDGAHTGCKFKVCYNSHLSYMGCFGKLSSSA